MSERLFLWDEPRSDCLTLCFLTLSLVKGYRTPKEATGSIYQVYLQLTWIN